MKKFFTLIFVSLFYLFLSPLTFAINDYTFSATNIVWNPNTKELKFNILNPSTPITTPIYKIIIRDPNTGIIPYEYDFSNPNSTECNNWSSCDFILSLGGGDVSNINIIFIQVEGIQPNWVSQNLNLNNYTLNSLPIPLLKQTSNPWQAQEYDTAHIWNPTDPTINAWGCALTSAVMILQYYGIYTIPGTNFTPLDPGTLNNWLKSQPDGYVGTGWVNWLALSRFSKLAASEHIVSSFDALEYQRTQGGNIAQLTQDINHNMPDILEEPGHFIVAKGINGNTFDINDPYYNRTTLNNGYNNTFLSLGRYIPSQTDLSYIMLTADPGVTLTVKDSHGNIVGSSFTQSAIKDPLQANKTNTPLKFYYLGKPDSGTYT